MKKQTKGMQGITLIALVVTIVVLLILAGVTISEITGNSIFNNAQQAKEENEKATASEKMTLKITTCQIKSYAERNEMATLEYLAECLDPSVDDEIEYVEGESQKTSDTEGTQVRLESIFTKLKEYPYEFEINSELQLASVDGIEVASKPTDIDISNLKIVSYDKNGGTGNSPESVINKYNDNVIVDFDNIPQKSGETFLGWSRNQNATEPEFTSETNQSFLMPNENVKLYAIYGTSKCYVIKDGIVQENIANLSTTSDGGYSCSVDYTKSGYIELKQSGGTSAYAYFPYWELMCVSDNFSNYSKMYVDFSYTYNSTYKGLRIDLNFLNNQPTYVSSSTNYISGYFINSGDKKFERKTISIDLNENKSNILDLVLRCYTCDSGQSTACIYNIWFE